MGTLAITHLSNFLPDFILLLGRKSNSFFIKQPRIFNFVVMQRRHKIHQIVRLVNLSCIQRAFYYSKMKFPVSLQQKMRSLLLKKYSVCERLSLKYPLFKHSLDQSYKLFYFNFFFQLQYGIIYLTISFI